MKQTDFLGKGFAFPFRIEGEGIATSQGEQLVEESIRILLGTHKGERVMRPGLGSGIESVLFDSPGAGTAAMIKHYVKTCLDEFEPRINVEEIKANLDPSEKNRIMVEIYYEIRSSNSKHNMVYPFYLEGSR